VVEPSVERLAERRTCGPDNALVDFMDELRE
jgi:hypothetical protein